MKFSERSMDTIEKKRHVITPFLVHEQNSIKYHWITIFTDFVTAYQYPLFINDFLYI